MRRQPIENCETWAIQRLQVFTIALVEHYHIIQIQEHGIAMGPGFRLDEADHNILEKLIENSERWPDKLNQYVFAELVLAGLLFAELSQHPLGHIIMGEVELPLGGEILRDKLPLGLYPVSCLACGTVMRTSNQQKFCKDACKQAWRTTLEGFKKIADLIRQDNTFSDKYELLLKAYTALVTNPNYTEYESRDKTLESKVNELISLGEITFFKNKNGQPVDYEGNILNNANLISDYQLYLD